MTEQNIYGRGILDLAANIPRIGRLDEPDATATMQSKLCGSVVTVDLRVRRGTIVDYAQEVKACALGQAAASIVAQNIVGTKGEEFRQLRSAMHTMLRDDGPPPAGRFAGLAALEPAKAYKARHPAIMLVFDAIVAALDQIAGNVEGAGMARAAIAKS